MNCSAIRSEASACGCACTIGVCVPTAMRSIEHALSGPCLDEKLAAIAGTGLSRG